MAQRVNFAWNCLNEPSPCSLREHGVFWAVFDLNRYTKSAINALGPLF